MSLLPDIAFACSPIAQLLVDPQRNTIAAANHQACTFCAMDLSGLHQASVSQLFSASLPQLIVFTQEVLAKDFAWMDTLYAVDANAQQKRVEISATKTILAGIQYLQMSFQDADILKQLRDRNEAQQHYRSGLNHWKRVEKVFQEFERENQLLLNAAGEGIYGVDNQGRTTFLNPAAEAMLGWSAEQLEGKNIHRAIHYSHADGSTYQDGCCPIYESFRDGHARTIDNEVFWTKDGKPIDVEYTSTPIYDNGHLVGAVVVFRDITQKKRDQQRLLAALDEVEQLKQRLEMENAYLQEEINSEFNHHKIIGNSAAINNIIHKIELAAPTDVTVLISGESGTGKELIARAIHESSQRKQRSLIRVNCAAIPNELFESEFFGHVKGAFTGAIGHRPGRFELADGGTLFLDEVGEIPLPLQGKLLRVLQEQQFERVGESKTRHVDVRLIAATNKDLAALVTQGKFREDLYFRLNVFPVESVPLRKRTDDIPLLARHFLNRACTKANRSGLKITLAEIERLQQYHWPGNIRELENVIERQVILARGNVLRFTDLSSSITPVSLEEVTVIKTAVQTDKEAKSTQVKNLISALKRTRGKVFGPGGAAELLNVPPTTLSSRIKRYNIDVRLFKGH